MQVNLKLILRRLYMLVRNTSNGKTEHVRNNDATIHSLIRLGVLEIVDDTPQPGECINTGRGIFPVTAPDNFTPTWNAVLMGEATGTGRTPTIALRISRDETIWYVGDPDKARKHFAETRKQLLPDYVLEEYRRLWDDPRNQKALGNK